MDIVCNSVCFSLVFHLSGLVPNYLWSEHTHFIPEGRHANTLLNLVWTEQAHYSPQKIRKESAPGMSCNKMSLIRESEGFMERSLSRKEKGTKVRENSKRKDTFSEVSQKSKLFSFGYPKST